MNKDELIQLAWYARENANPIKSGTKVGCAIESASSKIYLGWNVEGLWQTSIHAEVSAIAKIPVADLSVKAIAIVANCDKFTPCGACLDWITQFSEYDTLIYTQNKYKLVNVYSLIDLMPHYPRQ